MTAVPTPSTSGRSRDRLTHIPALDGVRGLAVAAVVAYHAGYLHGGFLGVDLFFVLSGFLITSLLLGERRSTGRIALGAFWARRARRLLPALLLLLVAVAAYAAWLAAPLELDAIRRDGVATLAYVANWAQIRAGVSYWDAFKAPSPLEHTWSLAIEEQFYVVWPLVVALALRRGRALLTGITVVAAVASIVSLVARYHPGADPSRAYFGSDTRAAAVLYGALAALAFAGRGAVGPWARRALGAVAVLTVAGVGAAWVVATGTSGWLYRWGFPATGIATAASLYALAVGAVPRPLRAALSLRPLRHLGAISYGVYLWHWPVDVVLTEARARVGGAALALVQATVTLCIAEASYHLLEMPIRRGALSGWRIRALTPAAFAATVAVVVAATAGAVVGGPAGESGVAAAPAPQATPPIDTALRVMVVGDSGAAFLGPGMAEVQAELPGPSGVPVQVGAFGEVGCGLPREGDGVRDGSGRLLADPAGCHDWPARWAAEATSFRPHAALLALAWPGIGDRLVGGQWRHPCDAAFDDYYRGEVLAAIDTLHASGARVLVATAPYAAIPGIDDARVDCLNAQYRAAVAARPGAEILDLAAWLCDGRDCRSKADDGSALRPDGVHFEGAGARLAGRFALGEALRLLSELPAPVGTGRVLLVGDSSALRLGQGFVGVTPAPFTLDQSTILGCGIVPGDGVNEGAVVPSEGCADAVDRFRAAAGSSSPDVIVLMTGAWEVLDHRVADRTVTFGTAAWDQLVGDALDRFVTSVGRGRPVVVVTAPCFDQAIGSMFAATDRNDPARVAGWNRAITEASARHPGVHAFDLGAILCSGGKPIAMVDGMVLRSDGVHLTRAGAELVWRRLIPVLRPLLPAG